MYIGNGNRLAVFMRVAIALLTGWFSPASHAQPFTSTEIEDAVTRIEAGHPAQPEAADPRFVLAGHTGPLMRTLDSSVHDFGGDSTDAGSRDWQGMQIGRHGLLFGYSGAPEMNVPAEYGSSYLYWLLPGFDAKTRIDHWLAFNGADANMYTLGYAWRRLSFEGSASAHREPRENSHDRRARIRAATSKLSFKAASGIELKLVRRQLSGLDQIETGQGLRRTAVAATYRKEINDAIWETTLAWGRSARREQEAVRGYLAESTVRLDSIHTFFGRVEQIGSDAMLRQNTGLPRRFFMLNKVTAGYFYDVRDQLPVSADVGALASKYLVPDSMTSLYGSDPVTYMVFVRFKLN